MLRDLNADGITMVVITHDAQVAGAMRRRIELRDGRVVADTRAARMTDTRAVRAPGYARPTCCRSPRSACAPARCARRCPVLGIAIGIAAIVAVLGITRSSQADLLARIDRLGTNLLTVANGQDTRRRRGQAAGDRGGRRSPAPTEC